MDVGDIWRASGVEVLTRLAQAGTRPRRAIKRLTVYALCQKPDVVATSGRTEPTQRSSKSSARRCHLFRPPGLSPDGAIIPRLLRRSGKDGTLQTAPTYRRSDCERRNSRAASWKKIPYFRSSSTLSHRKMGLLSEINEAT